MKAESGKCVCPADKPYLNRASGQDTCLKKCADGAMINEAEKICYRNGQYYGDCQCAPGYYMTFDRKCKQLSVKKEEAKSVSRVG